MDSFIVILFFGVFVLVLSIGFLYKLADYCENIRYVKNELKRAGSKNEVAFWKREILCLRLGLLPLLNPSRVKKIRRYIKSFHHKKQSENN